MKKISYLSLMLIFFTTTAQSAARVKVTLDSSSSDGSDSEEEIVWHVNDGDDPFKIPSHYKNTPSPAASRFLLPPRAITPCQNTTPTGLTSPLFNLAKSPLPADQTKLVRLISQDDSSPNPTDDRGATPLHYAATKGNKHTFIALLLGGADINLRTVEGVLAEECCPTTEEGVWIKDFMVMLREELAKEEVSSTPNPLATAIRIFTAQGKGNFDKVVLEWRQKKAADVNLAAAEVFATEDEEDAGWGLNSLITGIARLLFYVSPG